MVTVGDLKRELNALGSDFDDSLVCNLDSIHPLSQASAQVNTVPVKGFLILKGEDMTTTRIVLLDESQAQLLRRDFAEVLRSGS